MENCYSPSTVTSIRLLWLLMVLTICGGAQSAPTVPAPAAQEPQAAPQSEPTAAAAPPDAPSQQRQARIHEVLLSDETWTPITPQQKFRLFTDDLISPGTHLSLAGAAWLSWSTNDQTYMGPGPEGWAKRYSYSLADEAVGQFFGAYALPVLFKEDPRYIPRDKGTRKRRVVYAMTRVLVTRKDDGGQGFNIPKVGGTMLVSSLSNLYYPSGRDSSVGATFSRVGFSLATDAGYNTFVEFWPDVARKFRLGKFFQQLVRRTVRIKSTTY